MSVISERRKKRYAEDPEFRETVLATNRRWAGRNSDKINARKRERFRTDPDYRARVLASAARAHIKHVYGITFEDYDEMLARQHGCCKICFKPFTAFKIRLAIDHCHATGRVRGLLCKRCNTGAGFFDDDAERMRRAADHVEDPDGPTHPSVLAPCAVVLTAAAVTRQWLESPRIFAGPPLR